jgi:hypothetical protein
MIVQVIYYVKQITPKLSGFFFLKKRNNSIVSHAFMGQKFWARLTWISLLLHPHGITKITQWDHLEMGRGLSGFTLVSSTLVGLAGRLGSSRLWD